MMWRAYPNDSRAWFVKFWLFMLLVEHTSPTVIAGVTIFQDEVEFRQKVKGAGISVSDFEFTSKFMAKAAEFKDHQDLSQGNGARLGSILTFRAEHTDLPVTFVMRKHDTADLDSSFSVKTFEPGEHDDNIDAALRVSVNSNNDDFKVSFSTNIYHDGSDFQRVYAFGMYLSGNQFTNAETFVIRGIHGEELTTGKNLLNVHQGMAFLGVFSMEPIGSIQFDEDESDRDDVVITRMLFGLAEAHLLEGVSYNHKVVFWLAFNGFILVMLVLDLTCFLGRSKKKVRLQDAVMWSFLWVGMALFFDCGVYVYRGRGPAITWLTVYLLEKFLSVDNLFVFLTIFASFKTPLQFQHRVLTWGILGAVALRAVFIFTGVALVERFTWLLAVFGVFLVYTGLKTLKESFSGGEDDTGLGSYGVEDGSTITALNDSVVLRLIGSLIPITKTYENGSFFILEDRNETVSFHPADHGQHSVLFRYTIGACINIAQRLQCCLLLPFSCLINVCGWRGYKATPLFAVLIVVETTDMVFACDSIPAVLAVTTDPFIAYTSNIFAVLGLRALFFALAAAINKFHYLSTGLGCILLFIGVKMVASMKDIHLPMESTLLVVLLTLFLSVVLSILRPAPSKNSEDSNHVQPINFV